MNCFEWQTKVSDYLDGTLINSVRKEADEHLEQCPGCSERNQHYRIILASIANQSRSTLPISLRKSPFSGVLSRLDMQTRLSQWERAPWYIRTAIEGLGIVTMILIVVSAAPKIRALYEKNIEKHMDSYNISDSGVDADAIRANVLTRGNLAPVAANTEEFAGENDSSEENDDETGSDPNEVHVGNSEIWRFNFKTDSPHELRTKIVAAMAAAQISTDTPGIGGIEAPGGIQFDVLIPQAVVTDLKSRLEKLKDDVLFTRTSREDSPTESFTWYKNKSKSSIPAGKARVVIWLSQM